MIRVLVIDDSAVIRKVLSERLSRYPDIEVVGTALDPYIARDKIALLRPDVITLDVEMPRMNGLTFLQKLMQHFPLPVIMISSLTPENGENAMRALALGAVDVIAKPGSGYSTPDFDRIANSIRAAAAAKIPKADAAASPKPIVVEEFHLKTTHKVIAIGASTGGPQAIEKVLAAMPANAPGTVIVQHMPDLFTSAFAKRLNSICAMEVIEARDGDPVVPGTALVAPGNRHMTLRLSGARYVVRLEDGAPVHYQRPSIDVLFQSVAASAGENAVGILLTGMGSDGASGLLEMRQAGAHTIAQDEASSVVFGMPKEAIRLGGACEVADIADIAHYALRAISRRESQSYPRPA